MASPPILPAAEIRDSVEARTGKPGASRGESGCCCACGGFAAATKPSGVWAAEVTAKLAAIDGVWGGLLLPEAAPAAGRSPGVPG